MVCRVRCGPAMVIPLRNGDVAGLQASTNVAVALERDR